MRSDRELLADILESIERIERYARRGKKRFEQDELVQVWIVHHVEMIGEAVRRLSEEVRHNSPDIPWSAIIAMRNILVHDYFRIDVERVWLTVKKDLPELKDKLKMILETLVEG